MKQSEDRLKCGDAADVSKNLNWMEWNGMVWIGMMRVG